MIISDRIRRLDELNKDLQQSLSNLDKKSESKQTKKENEEKLLLILDTIFHDIIVTNHSSSFILETSLLKLTTA
jgi:hypothetical protein